MLTCNRLRVHATNEWHDLYLKSTTDELQKFFDYYLKGQNNDWKQTAPVRVCFLPMDQVGVLPVVLVLL